MEKLWEHVKDSDGESYASRNSYIKDCENKTSLTDLEVKKVVEYANQNHVGLSLDWLTNITDKQAEELWKIWGSLSLDWLTSITDKQAEGLWRLNQCLRLNWLKNITDKQAKELSKTLLLYLKWLETITNNQIEYFTQSGCIICIIFGKWTFSNQQKEIIKKRLPLCLDLHPGAFPSWHMTGS